MNNSSMCHTHKSLIGSADYKLDPTHPSGPIFQLQYNGGIQFNLVVPQSSDMRPPSYNIGDKFYVSNNSKDKNNKAEIIDIPTNNSTYYTIKHENSNNTELLDEKYITTIDQSKLVSNSSYNIHDDYTWLKNNAKLTLFLPKSNECTQTRLSSTTRR